MTGRGRFGFWLVAAFALGGLTVTAMAEEPHLARALGALQDAHDDLSQTRENKGGNPSAAMALIEKAEAEIKAVGQ
jgi:hypothetical protein